MAFSLARATGVCESSPAEQQEWVRLEGRLAASLAESESGSPGNLGQDEEWGLRKEKQQGQKNNADQAPWRAQAARTGLYCSASSLGPS